MERVVVTGLGVISPFGSGDEVFWNALIQGRSAVGPVRGFDTADFLTHVAAEVDCPDAPREDAAGRPVRLALAAARLALADARLVDADVAKAGLALGNHGNAAVTTMLFQAAEQDDRRTVTRLFPARPLDFVTAQAAGRLRLGGPQCTFSTACAAGNHALAYAFDQIRLGHAPVMLAGGVEVLHAKTFARFDALRMLAPERCQPFSRGRQGLILGEGAAVLVLEELTHVRKRGGRIYAEVLGYGLSSDAYHLTRTHPQGAGAALAIRRALQGSGLAAEEVDYISAHGCGTPPNDRSETAAIKAVFGAGCSVPVSSIKSMIGHSLGAAAALEACVCVLTLRDGVLPPTINYESPDRACDLDYVPNVARQQLVRVVLNNAFGFGGSNAVLVLGRWGER